MVKKKKTKEKKVRSNAPKGRVTLKKSNAGYDINVGKRGVAIGKTKSEAINKANEIRKQQGKKYRKPVVRNRVVKSGDKYKVRTRTGKVVNKFNKNEAKEVADSGRRVQRKRYARKVPKGRVTTRKESPKMWSVRVNNKPVRYRENKSNAYMVAQQIRERQGKLYRPRSNRVTVAKDKYHGGYKAKIGGKGYSGGGETKESAKMKAKILRKDKKAVQSRKSKK